MKKGLWLLMLLSPKELSVPKHCDRLVIEFRPNGTAFGVQGINNTVNSVVVIYPTKLNCEEVVH